MTTPTKTITFERLVTYYPIEQIDIFENWRNWASSITSRKCMGEHFCVKNNAKLLNKTFLNK